MFGYILMNQEKLSEKDKKYYQSSYCGLCKELKRSYGNLGRLSLNYDMTFVIILLSSFYKVDMNEKKCKCALHPNKKYNYFENDIIKYVSDMNIVLSYYKMLDNWVDDKNLLSIGYLKLIEKEYIKVKENYKEKVSNIEIALNNLTNLEKENNLNIDLSANESAKIYGEIFALKKDENKEKLYDFGFALGKFIYVMDACIDLKSDIKHKRYNALVMTSKEHFDDMLNVLMADVIEKYNDLEIKNSIIENILYSGVWTKYEMYKKRENRK